MTEFYEDKGLPFNKKKQEAVLGWLLIDTKFFLQARNLIKPDWFADPHVSKVYRAMLSWFDDHSRPPTVDEVRYSSEINREEPALRVKLQAKVSEAIHETQNFLLDALAKELTMWLRARIFYSGIHVAQKDFNGERLEQAYQQMDNALKDIKEATFLKDREISFANWRQDFERAEVEMSRGLTFGLDTVDDLLLPGHSGGSLLPGDTTIILAPTNVGKTTTMLTIALANVLQGKRVLLMTHEGRPTDIQQKIRQNYLDVSRKELLMLPSTDEGCAQLDAMSMYLGRFLTYVPYNKAGLTIEEVEPFIRRKQEEMMAHNNGVGYDMLVSDYPAKLTSRMAQGGNFSKRNIDEIVYGYFIQLALEYGFHSLLAIQTNREGARVNKGQKEERRLLVMEDVHESYGVMQEATNVITANRDALAKARHRMTLHIDKSRSSETGFAVVCRTDFEHAITHSNKLGSIWYRGVSTLADTVDDLLANPENNGQEIDITQFL